MGKYFWIGVTGLVLWLAETAHFGWNREAQSGVEHMLDNISLILMLWGIVGDIFTNLKIEKHINIQTKKVSLAKDEQPQ